MVTCAEALLPLAITAIFTTGGAHNSQHAKWGENTRVVGRKVKFKGGGGGGEILASFKGSTQSNRGNKGVRVNEILLLIAVWDKI